MITLGVLVAVGVLIGGDQTTPNYSSSEFRLDAQVKEKDPALGDLLFTDVVSVHYVGPGFPANPDGSLGGIVGGNGVEIKIYERYIVMEGTIPVGAEAAGTTIRTLRAYDRLGKIEQRILSEKAGGNWGRN